jgi:cytosine/adenosine deaminase-related metal-dependent hydrolase
MGESLLSWLKKYIWKWEGSMSAEEAKLCSELIYLQLIRTGVTAFSDYTSVRHTDQAFVVAKKFGLRALIGKTLMDRNSPAQLQEDTDQALKDSERLIRKWHKTQNSRLRFALTPRFAITCSDELLLGVKELSKKHNVLIQTHAHENKNEVKTDKLLYGASAIRHFHKIGLLGKKTILTHCVWLEQNEMNLLAKTGTKVVHCPGSNMNLASGVADVPKMLKKGIQVGLGSDMAAYYNVSPFEQMRLACLLQKVVATKPHALEHTDVFRMATSMGSSVLGFSQSGALAKGKKADVVLLSTKQPAFSPLNDVLSQLVYCTYPSAVTESIVDGKILMRNKKVLAANEGKIIRKGQELLGI